MTWQVCIMLETAEALEDVEAIMAVPGLDSVCVGANDLMSALGLPYPGTGREHLRNCPSPLFFARASSMRRVPQSTQRSTTRC